MVEPETRVRATVAPYAQFVIVAKRIGDAYAPRRIERINALSRKGEAF
jgi:hypothetical protein